MDKGEQLEFSDDVLSDESEFSEEEEIPELISPRNHVPEESKEELPEIN